jgi:hypothetical protein
MKILIMFMTLLLSNYSFASGAPDKLSLSDDPMELSQKTGIPFCAIIEVIHLKDDIIALGKGDKFMHCALSCQVALRCGGYETLSVGILKELWDLITPGDADMEDIEADMRGISLAINGVAINNKECILRCNDIYEGDKYEVNGLSSTFNN